MSNENPVDQLRELFDNRVPFGAVLAEVISFDSGPPPTMTVRPRLELDGVQAPNVVDVPVCMPGGGGWRVRVNPTPGDTVLLVLCTSSVYDWLKGRQGGKELTLADLSNAVAFPVMTGSAGVSTPGAGVTVQNDAGTVSLTMTDAGIEMTGNVTINGSVNIVGTVGSVLMAEGLVTGTTVAGFVTLAAHTHPGNGEVPTPGS